MFIPRSLYDPNEKLFTIYRNNVLISTISGHISDDHKFIDFHKLVDVKQSDIIVSKETEVKYFVTDIHCYGLDRFVGLNNMHYYAYISPVPIQKNHFSTLLREIEQCSKEDRAILLEMAEYLKKIAENSEPTPKGALKKFSDVISKYSPIALQVGQILLDKFL